MKLLIDSSTNYLYLALYENSVIDTMIRNGKNDHSETLVGALEQFLKRNNLETKDIDEILVGRGPGSYTGVRISGTIAKVLALIQNKKLYSFSTLDLMLSSQTDNDGLYLATIVAKKNHSYYKGSKIKNKKMTFTTTDLFSNNDELTKYSKYQIIEVNDDLFSNPEHMTEYLVTNKLYQEEDIFNYVPNYLRSEING